MGDDVHSPAVTDRGDTLVAFQTAAVGISYWKRLELFAFFRRERTELALAVLDVVCGELPSLGRFENIF